MSETRDRESDRHPSALLTDFYQLNMMQAYLEQGMTEDAAFELFFRKLPKQRGFLMAAGLEQALAFLESLHFSSDELDWLKKSHRFSGDFIDYLTALRFCGDVDAMPEGTIFFPDEPILRVTATLPVAQLVESRIINLLHFETLIASKAARMVLAAPGKQLIDFGLRRAHGSEAGLLAARASYVAGFAGSATLEAGRCFGIPTFGTMAHSFIEAFDDESAAFLAFARARPDKPVLLLDTYDTERAARKVVALAPRLKAEGITVQGVRLDSGDLAQLAVKVRAILNAGGLNDVGIFASGGLDEFDLADLQTSAPIDGFGVGTALSTSNDLPALDCAYKLQEYAGIARRKLSPGKATWPGRKQVWRRFDVQGTMLGDAISLVSDRQEGSALLVPVMRQGKRTEPAQVLIDLRQRAMANLIGLPAALRALEPPPQIYPTLIAPALVDLAVEVDRRLAQETSR